MVGETDDERQARGQGESGHRLVPHTADVRIEAWGTTRECCLVEAVLAMVESFADVSATRPTAMQRAQFAEISDDDLLAALLDEVVYRLEVHGQVPLDVEVEEVEAEEPDGSLDVRLAVADLSDVEITGAVPKAVSWNELHIGPGPYGWSCAVTIDV
ncbi:archease [Streptomyces sporangiiformans]|uniref:Archease n=1 Tax=Streptomyces sporangiiformans TaxID=2315329 RepID=A0A505CYJ5_9ACTN|nr:archease [Streptomyces sporangiiformans]TPQ15477.1 archease [Streptomyces sporangiiformans]